jgi:hypothetical protein
MDQLNEEEEAINHYIDINKKVLVERIYEAQEIQIDDPELNDYANIAEKIESPSSPPDDLNESIMSIQLDSKQLTLNREV